MDDDAVALARIEGLPANRPPPRQLPNPRRLDSKIRRDLEQRIDTLPPLATEEQRHERQVRFARFIARAVRRGAMPASFAKTLLDKLMPNQQTPARTIQLPGLPRIADAASYRRHLEVLGAAVAEGRITVGEAKIMQDLARETWSALRAERREAR